MDDTLAKTLFFTGIVLILFTIFAFHLLGWNSNIGDYVAEVQSQIEVIRCQLSQLKPSGL